MALIANNILAIGKVTKEDKKIASIAAPAQKDIKATAKNLPFILISELSTDDSALNAICRISVSSTDVNSPRRNELTPDRAISGPDDSEVEESHKRISNVKLPITDAASTWMLLNELKSTFRLPEMPLANGALGL